MVWDRQCLEDSELKGDTYHDSINDEGVYRTAPLAPGLLNIYRLCLLALSIKVRSPSIRGEFTNHTR